MKKDETIQNYLETIYIISLKKESVRAIDVANYLHFSRPTVSIALKQLEDDGYLINQNNLVLLTEKGMEVAKNMYERHELIANILINIGVSKDQAYIDSCLIEHDLSNESFEAIKKTIENKKY